MRALVVAVAILLALSGCALDGVVGSASLPAGTTRDELLSTMAACHLLRVGQNDDLAATDESVIAAASRYGYSAESIVERTNRLAKDYQSREALLIKRATAACQQLSTETGVTSALVRFEPDGQIRTAWLRVDGAEIRPGFAGRTIAEIRSRRAIGLVINSPGGSVYEARKLGRYLRDNGLRSAVDQFCTSACVDVLAGGVERLVTRDAKLGIHQSKVPSRYGSYEGGQFYVADSFRYLGEMGVDPDVAIVAASVPNDKILLIPLAEALSTGLVTGVVKGFE